MSENQSLRGNARLRGDELQERIATDQGTRADRLDQLRHMEESDRRKLFKLPRLQFLDPARLLPWERRNAH